jgi:CIC family chloride channel protein
MATMFAAVARAPLTAMLIVFEVTGARDYGLVLPLMLSAILATFLADRALPESVYTLALRRRGIQLAASAEVDILDIVQVGEVMAQRPVVAAPPMSLTEVSHLLQQHRLHGVPVVEDGRLVGILTSSDIVRAGGSGAPVTVREAMTKRPVTIPLDWWVSSDARRPSPPITEPWVPAQRSTSSASGCSNAPPPGWAISISASLPARSPTESGSTR